MCFKKIILNFKIFMGNRCFAIKFPQNGLKWKIKAGTSVLKKIMLNFTKTEPVKKKCCKLLKIEVKKVK